MQWRTSNGNIIETFELYLFWLNSLFNQNELNFTILNDMSGVWNNIPSFVTGWHLRPRPQPRPPSGGAGSNEMPRGSVHEGECLNGLHAGWRTISRIILGGGKYFDFSLMPIGGQRIKYFPWEAVNRSRSEAIMKFLHNSSWDFERRGFLKHWYLKNKRPKYFAMNTLLMECRPAGRHYRHTIASFWNTSKHQPPREAVTLHLRSDRDPLPTLQRGVEREIHRSTSVGQEPLKTSKTSHPLWQLFAEW